MASPRWRDLRSRLLYRAMVLVGSVTRVLPLSVSRTFGRALGSLAFAVVGRERRRALQNIARAFPEWPEARRNDTIRGMFRHLGEMLLELLWLRRGDLATRDRLTVLENAEPLAAAIKAGRSIIVLSGHCGNWEWGAHGLATLGSMTVLQRERDDPQMNQFMTDLRARAGIHTIDRGSRVGNRELVLAARRPGTVVFLIDQSIRAESAQVPFFGIPAPTPLGPIKLAIRTGAMLAAILVERRDGRTHVRFEDLIETQRDDDPVALAARFTAAIERQVRRAPEQWVWMHDRWRQRPEWDVQRGEGLKAED